MNEDCKYYEEYYDYILKGYVPESSSKKLVFDIVKDLTDRRGLRHEFQGCDGGTQGEIIDAWIEIAIDNR